MNKIDREVDEYRLTLSQFKSKYPNKIMTTTTTTHASSSAASSSGPSVDIDVRNLAPITESSQETQTSLEPKRSFVIPPIVSDKNETQVSHFENFDWKISLWSVSKHTYLKWTEDRKREWTAVTAVATKRCHSANNNTYRSGTRRRRWWRSARLVESRRK